MTLDWIVGVVLVACLGVAACSMFGVGLIGMLTQGRFVRCQRCGRPGLSTAGRALHEQGCPHPLVHLEQRLHLHH